MFANKDFKRTKIAYSGVVANVAMDAGMFNLVPPPPPPPAFVRGRCDKRENIGINNIGQF